MKFSVIEGWGKLPEGWRYQEVAGAAVDKQDFTVLQGVIGGAIAGVVVGLIMLGLDLWRKRRSNAE